MHTYIPHIKIACKMQIGQEIVRNRASLFYGFHIYNSGRCMTVAKKAKSFCASTVLAKAPTRILTLAPYAVTIFIRSSTRFSKKTYEYTLYFNVVHLWSSHLRAVGIAFSGAAHSCVESCAARQNCEIFVQPSARHAFECAQFSTSPTRTTIFVTTWSKLMAKCCSTTRQLGALPEEMPTIK